MNLIMMSIAEFQGKQYTVTLNSTAPDVDKFKTVISCEAGDCQITVDAGNDATTAASIYHWCIDEIREGRMPTPAGPLRIDSNPFR